MTTELQHYPRVTHAFYSTPWAILPEKLREMEAFIQAKAAGRVPPGEGPPLMRSLPIDARLAAMDDYDDRPRPAAGPPRPNQVIGRTAIINVYGVLSQRMNLFSSFSGGTSTELIGQQLDSAMADKTIRSIVLRIDSPGGDVFGTEELARKIHAARAEKKIIAVADSMAASAAYWLAAQATEIVVTTGGQVGSIGVVAVHQDESKAEEMAGVKTTLIHAGKFKVEGSPTLPLSAEGRDHYQAIVDAYYRMFVAAVARGRSVTETRVERDFGQGRMKVAKDAVESGMADRVATLEQVLHRLGADAAAAASAAASTANVVALARAMEAAP